MVLHILRALFVLIMAAVGFVYLEQASIAQAEYQSRETKQRVEPTWANLPIETWLVPGAALTVAVLLVCIDILSPRSKLAVMSGTFFGLVVGLILAYVLSFVVNLAVSQYFSDLTEANREKIAEYINIVLGIVCCYFSISFILQTKDDFRFIVPYVEFSKQTKGARPMLLDTSVLIDGRINDIATTGILESQIIVPRFVLNEMQAVADSSDKLKRNRGRRGLDVLTKLQSNPRVEVILYDSSGRDSVSADVDQKLMNLALDLGARVLTTDFNLNKVAQLRGVSVININDLANALKPVVLPGEKMTVRIIKPGEEAGQGVGYLEDGTMVVVEQGRSHMNEEVEFVVTSALQTSAGRMIFGKMGNDSPGGSREPSARRTPRSARSDSPA